MVVPFTETGIYKKDLVAWEMGLVLNVMNLNHLLVHLAGDLQ